MYGKQHLKILSALLVVTSGTTSGFQQPRPQQQRLGLIDAPTVESDSQLNFQKRNDYFSAEPALSAGSTASENNEDRVLDLEAIAKYGGAIAIQMTLFKGFFTGIDALTTSLPFDIPFVANFFFFYVFSLKSRVFNPMSNERPRRDTKEIENAEEEVTAPARKMPEWTPPGVVFPIVWILLIGPLRAASSALLVTSSGVDYASTTILALMLHLSIGDTWNTINNVERRYGTSILGVVCVWLSAAFAAYSYGQVDPLAGKLLSLPLVWLTIASSLIIRTWQLNPSEESGQKESLLPTKPISQDGSITKLTWFEAKN